jgi:hypothetical protein
LSAACLTAVLLAGQTFPPEIFRDVAKPYSVTVRVVVAERNDRRLGWGVFANIPNRRIGALQILAGRATVHVPASAWADLANPNSVTIRAERGGCVVRIVGGDASESYRALVRVRGLDVVERIVESGEFPGEHRERTRYRNVAPKED